ncbi:MAG: ACP S-malonyltransferase [Chloroflexaceae bacterium]|nr:ACP S-malonyltransferase [Chloroflexaceae bacterium]NJO04730.1 ACP S-malonyltransferase [Chloroflexaceae bacterium]
MAVAWVFPGQGAQVVGMGRDLYHHSIAAREVFDHANTVLGFDLARLCFEGPDAALMQTENAQPALLTVSIALLRTFDMWIQYPQIRTAVAPAAVAGHSLGAYTALVAAGSIDLSTALRLVRRRGELMAAARDGTMAAIIGMELEPLERLCADVWADTGETVVIANHNAPDQLVISGATIAVERVSAQAKKHGARRVIDLKVSAAFHSPLMAGAVQQMQQMLTQISVSDPLFPVWSNVSATPIVQACEVREELQRQVVSPVRWMESVQAMYGQGIDTFIELGAGKVLTGLIKRIVPAAHIINLRSLNDIEDFVVQLTTEANLPEPERSRVLRQARGHVG